MMERTNKNSNLGLKLKEIKNLLKKPVGAFGKPILHC
jgi:hypothetical protein